MKFKLPPVNRIVAFAGPYISLASGAIASWLVVNLQVLGSLNLGQDKLAHGIAYGATAGLGAILPHLGMQKWLEGHQIYFEKAFDLVKELDPAIQTQVLTALPLVKGDITAALTQALAPPAIAGLAAPASTTDTSGDREEPNALTDVEAPPLDALPDASALGNDAVHAPPEVTPAAVASGEAGAQ